jgi:ElaB/YqjD/DUF883 family membrane-anchored ribosome-binding protein
MDTDTQGTVTSPMMSRSKDRVLDAARHAAHLSHEAKMLKSIATDTFDEGMYAARRALRNMKRSVARLDDFRDQAVYTVKRQPLKSVAIAAGLGLMVGTFVGWYGGRFGRAHRGTTQTSSSIANA